MMWNYCGTSRQEKMWTKCENIHFGADDSVVAAGWNWVGGGAWNINEHVEEIVLSANNCFAG